GPRRPPSRAVPTPVVTLRHRILGVLTVILIALAWAPSARAGAGGRSAAARQDVPVLELVSHSPTVPQRGRLDVAVALGATPAEGSVEVVVHGRVRSRSELARSMEGESLRSAVYRVTRPIAELPPGEGDSRRVIVSLDSSEPGGVAITAAGAYPVEIIARDALRADTGPLVTHMVV